MTTWDVDQAQRIGVAIKALRGDRSAQWLSEQTAEIGMPISRSTIADIENRRRRYVTTAELSVLAWALAVPPVRLLYPDLPDGSVEAVPGVTVSSMVAVTWFSGEATLGPGPEDVAAWSPTELQRETELINGARIVQLSRQRCELNERIRMLSRMAQRLRTADADGESFVEATLVPEIAAAEKLLEKADREAQIAKLLGRK